MIDPGLQGKTVLITGANNPQGIGAATARAFACQGARLGITYLKIPRPDGAAGSPETETPGAARYHTLRARDAGELIRTLRETGAQCEAAEADLSDPDAAAPLFDWAERVLGPVDILINNAAHYEERDTAATLAPDALERTLRVNVQGTVGLILEYARRYRSRGGSWGRIVNLSTDAARAFAGQISYGASKAAVEAFTRSLAVELGPLGITVNAVAPGPVQTGYIPPELETALLPSIPLRRIGDPEEIADAIVFLASEQARWITGQVIQVAGGHAL